MNVIINILILILMMGFLVLIHELGHFLWAKKFGVHIYEFSIGMGPLIKEIKGKDGISYCIRALPIGGYVSMAGEVYEDSKKIKKDKFMCNKPWWQRLIILVAGVTNNFICAILIFFALACMAGAPTFDPKIEEVVKDSAAYEAGVQDGDVITKVNGKKTKTWDKAQILLLYKTKNDTYKIEVKHEDGTKDTYNIKPNLEKDENGNERKVFGIKIRQEVKTDFVSKVKYPFKKFSSLVQQMWYTIGGLFTGKISVNELSGPVGIYSVVGQSRDKDIAPTFKDRFENILFLVGFISLNLGFVNILPFPAFDGGRVLFILIEKIIRRPIDSKIENAFHTVGFVLIMLLMIYITIHDIMRLI